MALAERSGLLKELLGHAFEVYRQSNPWAADGQFSPKSVVREMWERAFTFREFVSVYGLTRSEGAVLRYLSDAFKALRSGVPAAARTEELTDIVEWLGELVRQVDSSLLDEWEQLTNPDQPLDVPVPVPARPRPLTGNERAFTAMVTGASFTPVGKAEHGTALGNPRDCVSEAPASNYSTPRVVTTYGLSLDSPKGCGDWFRVS